MGSPFCVCSCVHLVLVQCAFTSWPPLLPLPWDSKWRPVQPGGWILGVEVTELLERLEGDIVRAVVVFIHLQ